MNGKKSFEGFLRIGDFCFSEERDKFFVNHSVKYFGQQGQHLENKGKNEIVGENIYRWSIINDEKKVFV